MDLEGMITLKKVSALPGTKESKHSLRSNFFCKKEVAYKISVPYKGGKKILNTCICILGLWKHFSL